MSESNHVAVVSLGDTPNAWWVAQRFDSVAAAQKWLRAEAPAGRYNIVAMRYENWKIVFAEQRATGTLQIWAEPFTSLRVPKMFDLRADPYERADITSNTYWDWVLTHAYLVGPASAEVGKFLATFADYPPAQRPDSFSIDQIQDKLNRQFENMGGGQ